MDRPPAWQSTADKPTSGNLLDVADGDKMWTGWNWGSVAGWSEAESSSRSAAFTHTGSTTDRQGKKGKNNNNNNILLSHPSSTRQARTLRKRNGRTSWERVRDRFFDTWMAQVVGNWRSDGTGSCQNAFRSNWNFSSRIRSGRIPQSGEAGGSVRGGSATTGDSFLVPWLQQPTRWAPLSLRIGRDR